MKKNLLLFAIAPVLLFSCTKEKVSIAPPPSTEVVEDSTYIINGIADMKVSRFGKTISGISLLFKTGKQEKIKLSIQGLPAKTSAIFEPAAGIPGFSTNLEIRSTLATPGIYPVVIKGTSESGQERLYKVNLTVLDNFNCDSFLINNIGRMKTSSININDSLFGFTRIFYNYYDYFYLSNLYLEPWPGNQFPVTAFSNGNRDNDLVINFNCGALTLDIPEKMVYGNNANGQELYTVSGNGSVDFEKQKLYIYYSVTTPLNVELKYKISAELIY